MYMTASAFAGLYMQSPSSTLAASSSMAGLQDLADAQLLSVVTEMH
jgi:hypothetical protein